MTRIRSGPFAGLNRHGYGVIMADPPWNFTTRSPKGHGKSPQRHYNCMPLADIMALPVADLAAPDCACFMWATAPMLPHAVQTLSAWGFTFKSAGAWAKQSSTGQAWAFGTGYVFRNACEFFLLGTRGAPKAQSRSVRNLVVAPVREHSRKPDQARADLEALYPGPYLELFARTTMKGWRSWGNDTKRFASAA